MTEATAVDWVGADWGTSRLRAWAFDAQGRTSGSRRDGPGMGRLAGQGAAAFEAALVETLGDWLDAVPGGGRLPVLICGMAGARQGWCEAPYLDLPLTLDSLGAQALTVECVDPRLATTIVPGLAQRAPDAPDVIRGEETQILGFLAGRAPGDRRRRWTLCLPGTHSKWVQVAGGQVTAFRTYMTGELFALLAEQSILRHGLAGAEGDDPAAFADGVRDALDQPGSVPAKLFALRAGSLLLGTGAPAARARLSGLLIGQELATACPCLGPGDKSGHGLALVGDPALVALYAEALRIAGCAAESASGEAAVIAGLGALHRAREEVTP